MAVAVAGVSLLTLARAHQYIGHIYHGWDAQFYYSLAHSVVFDRDLDITNDIHSSPQPQPFDRDGDGSFESAPRGPDGRIPSKYPIGLSIVEAPFLLAGNLIRRTAEFAGLVVPGAPGYSSVEIWIVAVGLVSLFAWGVAALYSLIAEEFGRLPAAVGVLCCWAGTSLFFYSAVFPFMAHATSFVALVIVMHATKDLHATGPGNRAFTVLGLALAATFLIRPQQIVVVVFLLPIIVAAVRTRSLADWFPGAVAGVSICVVAVAAQLFVSHAQFARATLNSYSVGGEGFAWLQPQLAFVLLDPTRGLLVYSPIVGLAMVGFIVHARAVPAYVWPQLGNAALQLYLVAAWSSPEQGDSFGARMLSDNSSVVAAGIAILVAGSSRGWRWVVAGCALAAVTWTFIQLVWYVLGA